MLKNYFKVAFRNLSRQKVLASINILGLSLGIACFTLFLLYAVNEFSFDRFHLNAKNIYRVYRWTEAMEGEPAKGDVYMPMPLGPALKQDLPDVENYVRLRDGWGNSFVKIGNNVLRLKVSYADPQIFSMFDFKFKSGNPKSLLQGLYNLIITETKAKELFGNDNAVGKTIQIKVDGNFKPFTITAVANDPLPNSSIQFDAFANFHFFETSDEGQRSMNKWTRSSYITFVQLRRGSHLPNDAGAFMSFRNKYYPDEEAEFKKHGLVWNTKNPPVKYGLQPLLSMHTDTKIAGGAVENVDPKTIWILLSIAAGVLLIACINFTTLAIGRSAGRSKEVGVRKVIGAVKKQLVFQFLSEALLLSIISTLLGLLMAKLLLPYFNQLSGRELIFSFALYPEMIWLLVGLTVFVGLLSGSYPAMVLSSFKPIEVLKSKMKIGGANIFTKSLVTLQFAVSIALIISTIIILQQIKYMNQRNPGFNKENVVMVDASETDSKKIYPLFKQALSVQPGIEGIASAELGLGADEGWSSSGFNYNGKQKKIFEYFIDPDYVKVMGMQLIAGRNFSPSIAEDTTLSVIVNESLVKDFEWSMDSVIGHRLTGYTEGRAVDPIIIGVVKDFNYRSLSQPVQPQLFHQFKGYAPYKFFVRIKPGNPSELLSAMNKAWKSVVTELPFKYYFLDEELNKFYKAEQRWSSIVGWAGGISIFLACLGLFGLAALAAINRTKEIGIRKVLGASITNIINLLSKDFLKLVIIALIIASPLAWYFMHKWLQDFAYRINIGWIVFVTTGFLVLLIALLTISFQAIKAARSNPVKSLRTE
ncbi:MAG: ABC transporter permease [Ferruginibacter sp.]